MAKLSEECQATVELLEDLLVGAKDGKVMSLFVVFEQADGSFEAVYNTEDLHNLTIQVENCIDNLDGISIAIEDVVADVEEAKAKAEIGPKSKKSIH